MQDQIKLTFMQQCLRKYNESVIETMRIAAKRAGVGVTGEGLQSLAYKAVQEGGGAYSELSFKEYLRMVDMGAGRAHPLGGLRSTTVALQSRNYVGRVQVKDRVRKPKKFYSKIAYGKLTWLENMLLHRYTEETVEGIRRQLMGNTV